MIIDDKEVEIQLEGKTYHCALDVTMAFIGGKWKSVVLWYLRKHPKRYSELKRLIPDITEKMLSIQLRELERNGLICRKIYPEVPPRVEYYLSEEGKNVLPVVEAMAQWGRQKATKEGVYREKE